MKFISASTVNGTVIAPPSKSMTGRAIAAALLSGGTSVIFNPSSCDDSLAALRVAEAMGAEATRGGREIVVKGNGALRGSMTERVLDCGESGLCIRMFAPIAALTGGEVTLTGTGSLLKRPMHMVEEIAGLGALCTTNNGYAPITIKGPAKGGSVHVDASESSQFLTGLLMALPLCRENSLVTVSNLRSRPYVAMTLSLLRHYGINITREEGFERFSIRGNQSYRPCVYRVEGDWSAAAFLLVAGATAGSVKVTGLKANSFQADKAVMEALDIAGAEITIDEDYVLVARNELKAFEIDAKDCPDLFPPLVALASCCSGISVIHGAQRIRHKESDRAHALCSEFGRLGIAIELSGDTMKVHGGKVTGAQVDSHNDHRIAMACAIAALNGEGKTAIGNWKCVAKSYPGFFTDIERLQGNR
ncbi:MAG: 3-phosphoshikimate 1-carboxyvinyltransferase [Syntrophorhabdus sp. PtaU1.Bin058]|nr:MAG: 3-phosphoshikimate 1-carboxyvinyltransferase [Syntrophorhabdus sp. PtaU1.Bin058]